MSEGTASEIDSCLATRLSKERRLLGEKREAKRIIALEAMQVAEKRRIRQKEAVALGSHVESIFSDESNINKIRKQHEIEIVHGKERVYNKTMADIKNIQVNRDESMNRTADEFQTKLKFKDQAKVEEKRRIKQMQIKNYYDALAREKIRKQRMENELKRNIENRIRNDEGNLGFNRQKLLEIMNSIKQHRRITMEQMENPKLMNRIKYCSNLVPLSEDNVIAEFKRTDYVNPKKMIYLVDELKAMRPPK